jgi:hypothetical protein
VSTSAFDVFFAKKYRAPALVACALVSLLPSGLSSTKQTHSAAARVGVHLPHRAIGDFDGDGRSDSAEIQDSADGLRISIALSGPSGTANLKAAATELVGADVDHDGDIDLVALTSAGEVLILLNDGHGRFTRQEASRTNYLSEVPVADASAQSQAAMVAVNAPLVIPHLRREAAIAATRIRPPTAPLPFELAFLSFQSLRAPPALSA